MGTLRHTNFSIDSAEDILKGTQIDEYYTDMTVSGKKLSGAELEENPYPGLRPFKTSESIVFFGREGLSTDLAKRLAINRFLAVIGASGTGKSSLVRAGLLPSLNILPGRHGSWKIIIFRPGKNPFGNFVQALSKAGLFSRYTAIELHKTLSSSSFGFEKLYISEENERPFNTLIIVDQFEELFRYRDNSIASRNEAALFAKMLIDITSTQDLNAYVMITMRSEFLGDCVKMPGLPEAINNGQYLVPRLKREQLIDAISEPAFFSGADVEKGFAEKLIGEIGDNMDQLPVLQHALRRTYDEAKKNTPINEKIKITYKNYADIGKMESAIDKHADDIYNNLSEIEKKYCAVIFKSITDKATDGRGLRRPLPFSTIAQICQKLVSNPNKTQADAGIKNVITAFRKDKVNFLLPSLPPAELLQEYEINAEINDKTEIDISHESVMRIWKKLTIWIDEEARDAELLRELLKRDPEDLLRGNRLSIYKDWITQKGNIFEWANLYRPAYINEKDYPDKFDTAITIIEKSLEKQRLEEIERQLEQEKKEKEKQKKAKRNQLTAVISVIAAIICLAFGAYAFTQGRAAKIAVEQKAKADANAAQTEINRQKDLANFQKKQAEIAEENAKSKIKATVDSVNAKDAIAKAKLDVAKEKAKATLAQAEKEAALAQERNKQDSIEIALLRNARKEIISLTKERFYQSNYLNDNIKDNYLDSLLELKLSNEKDTLKFKNLLWDLNGIAIAKELEEFNPNIAFNKAIQVFDSSKSKLSNSILLDIANTNLFYTQKLSLPINSGFSKQNPQTMSPNAKSLAFQIEDTIKIYKINNNEFVFNKDVIINNLESDVFSKYGTDYHSVPSLMFIDENHLLAFTSANNIYDIDLNGKIASKHLTEIIVNNDSLKSALNRKHYASAISADGKTLILDYKDYNIIILKINEKNLSPIVIPFRKTDGYIDNINTSYNGKTLIIKQGEIYKIFDVENNKLFDQFSNNITYANFSNDGHTIITKDSRDTVYMYDLNTKKNERLNLSIPGKIKFISLSPNKQRLIIKSGAYEYSTKIYYYQKDNSADSINYRIIPKQLPYLRYSDILFTDNNDLIDMPSESYTNKGYVRIWKDFGKIDQTNISMIINSLPPLTNDEKIQAGFIKFEDIADKNELKESAEYYYNSGAYDSSYLLNAKKLYLKLLSLTDSLKEQQYYLTKLTYINTDLFEIDSNWQRRAEGLKEIIFYRKNLLAKYPDSIDLKIYLSSNYWNLSWAQLFINEYDSAAYSAEKGYELDTLNNGIITNQALGYLLSGKCEKANTVYELYAKQAYLTTGKKFTSAFLQDFNDLEKAGIITANNKEIYAHVQKVRDFLTGKTNTLDCK